jgi:hypothetical protein
MAFVRAYCNFGDLFSLVLENSVGLVYQNLVDLFDYI